MHDRYFFAADILSVVLAFLVWQFSLAPLLVQFASLLGYHAYLKMRYLFPMRYGAYGLIAVMIMAAAILIYELYREKFNKFKFL
jgi:signal transduction histidine kinase